MRGKRFFAAVLCAMLLLALLPGAALADPVLPDPNPAGNTIDTIPVNDTLGVNNGTVTTNNGTVTANYGTVTTNNGTVHNYTGGVVSLNNATGTVYCMGGMMKLSGGLARNDGMLIIPAGYTLRVESRLHNAGRIHNFGTIAGNELISHEGRGEIINYTGGVIEDTVVFDRSRLFNVTSPVITLDPVSQTVAQGGSATFTVAVAGGPGALSCQWRFSSDGATWQDIASATGASYTIDPVTASDAGSYACVATFMLANATSSAATLTVPAVASVTVNPSTASVERGGSKTFTAAVTGTNSPAQTVTWTVEGGTASTIDANGKLTVAATETATTLTVKATSTVDISKSGTATVTVTTLAPTVTVTPSGSVRFPQGAATGNAVFTVTSSDGTLNASANYASATLDGQPINLGLVGTPGADGSVANGSLIATVNQAKLNTLTVGDHPLVITLQGAPFADMTVRGVITVTALGGGADDVGPDVPKTGDNAPIALLVGLLLLSGAGLAIRRKRKARQ